MATKSKRRLNHKRINKFSKQKSNRESNQNDDSIKIPNSFREKLRFYLIDCETRIGKSIDAFILFLNLLICIIFVIETYDISQAMRALLWKIEVITVIIFIVEYFARIYASQKRFKQITDLYSIIDFVAILPTLLIMFNPEQSFNIAFVRILRIIKTFRIFRFLRFTADPYFFFGKITWHVLKVIRLVVTIFLIFFVASGVFFTIENGVNPNVSNFGDAFYFIVVTLTTVGFGDITPVSDAGKWATVLMIISGIMLIPWQASQVIKEWLQTKKKKAICKKCGLVYHDEDASHCKACGKVIYQEYLG
ncbi:ion transporter [Candidatus Woesearchaeota archaeon]|jgi:voltage-gated potassium channel|nr:ion transporter [Candidatus Woesearchaeota archaeon]